MKRLLVLLLTCIVIFTTHATHIRGGEINAVRDNCRSLLYTITVTVYLNTESGVTFGGEQSEGLDVLDFGDGQKFIIPIVPTTPRPDLGLHIGVASYTIEHTYRESGHYLISYREPNRNEFVLNMANSVGTTFYIETLVNTDPSFPCNPSLRFLCPPVFRMRSHILNTISLSVLSKEEGIRLRYKLVSCKRDRGLDVDQYQLPETASINPTTGLFSWDGKFNETYPIGEFSFAVLVERFFENVLVGYMVRDFQILVGEGIPERSFSDSIDLNEYERVYVSELGAFNFKLFAETSGANTPILELFSERPELVTLETYDSVTLSSKIKVGKLSFVNDSNHLRDLPYGVTVRSKFSGADEVMDLNYLLFTKDVYLPEIVTDVSEVALNQMPYPNPANKFVFTICEEGSEYTVYDNSMKQVLIGKTDGEINVSTLLSGVYIIYLKSKRSEKTKFYRFVKI